ncbi:MAG: TerB family tellurite resistance protein [Spirochaetaceae bacterium]|nr:TerB family tellurite resistance protein [Spirochaetaceae bacterium]
MNQENKKNQFQQKITDSLMAAFESVISKKKEWYSDNKNIYTPSDVQKLISKCGNTNAWISGGAGLIPGPLGMLVVVPEISLIIKNQIEMIYDIGKANNKTGKELSKELVIGVFASSIGNAGIGLITIHVGTVLVKRASLRVFQKIVAMVGGKVTQRLLKSIVAKWLPGVGAAAMAVWSKYTTNLIGEKAQEIFFKDIIFEEGELINIPDDVVDVADTPEKTEQIINRHKITLLSNLLKVSGDIAEVEVKQITSMIKSMDFSEDLAQQLLSKLKILEPDSVDFDLLKEHDETLSILIDMVALAKADKKLHKLEIVYIKEVGKKLGLSEVEIKGILNF